MESFVFGAVMAAIAILGLNMAAQAGDAMFQVTGLLLFAFGVAFNFALIARAIPRKPPEKS